jgi:hypothetical protein
LLCIPDAVEDLAVGKDPNVDIVDENVVKVANLLVAEKGVWHPHLGLKRKFPFSYFAENSAKIYFRFSRKKLAKSYENNENFRENKNV